jgi:ABC-type uncharacterized transport system substrate-binding protein
VLFAGAENDPNQQADQAKFSDALRGSGWTQGPNITVDYRWAAGDLRRIQMFAKELVNLKPDLLVGQSTPVVAALKSETKTIPIVFVQVADPVGSGLIAGRQVDRVTQGNCAALDWRCTAVQSRYSALFQLLPANVSSCGASLGA